MKKAMMGIAALCMLAAAIPALCEAAGNITQGSVIMALGDTNQTRYAWVNTGSGGARCRMDQASPFISCAPNRIMGGLVRCGGKAKHLCGGRVPLSFLS